MKYVLPSISACGIVNLTEGNFSSSGATKRPQLTFLSPSRTSWNSKQRICVQLGSNTDLLRHSSCIETMSGSSVREYARYHGLASEHRSDDVIQELLNVYNLNNHNNHNAPTKEPTPPLYPDFSTFTPPFEESKLQLGRAGGEFLASCVRPPSFAVQWDKYLPDPHRKRKLKLEVPLLATDHEEDVAAFKRDVRHGLD